MSTLLTVIIFSWIAGLTAFIGGTISYFERTVESKEKDEIIHAIMAFGGGILVSAVAFSLAPEGMEVLSPWLLTVTFLGGGVVFSFIDRSLSKRGSNKAQFLAMLMDFIPEALAVGALFSKNKNAAILLAIFIAAQNLPEGFNSFREIISDKIKPGKHLFCYFQLVFWGRWPQFSDTFFWRESQ